MTDYVVGGPILPIKAKALVASHPTARFMTSKLRKFTDLYPSVSSIPEIVKVGQAALLVFAVVCQCLFVTKHAARDNKNHSRKGVRFVAIIVLALFLLK